ncbi:MAG: alpha/beta hydrolase [Candidatus Abyssubacteria bacterium]
MSRPDCSLLDQPIVLQIMFYPRRDPYPVDEADVFFPVAPGIRVGGRLHAADRESPLLLLFHGNGEIASDYDDIAQIYGQMGLSFLAADYRGYGKSDGSPTASALLDDALAVYRSVPDVVSERGLSPSRVIVMGRSLGSAAALEVVTNGDGGVSELIIESGFASALGLIERLGGPLPASLQGGVAGFDNAVKIERVGIPTLVIHGEADQIIPVEHGKTLFGHCRAREKRLVIIPGAGHNDLLLLGGRRYFEAIRTFMDKR